MNASASGPGRTNKLSVHQLGRRELTTLDAVGESLAVGPIAAAGFGAYLLTFHAGAASPFVIAATFVAVMALAWTVSRYARRFAGPGTVYEYIARAHGRPLGVLAALFFFMAASTIFSAIALIAGLLFQAFSDAHLGFDPTWWAGGLVITLFMFGIAYRGIRLAVRAQLALTLASAIPLLILAFDVILDGGATGNTLSVFDPGEANGSDLFRGFLVALVLFGGWEWSAALGEETHSPHRSIPRAMLGTVAACGAFYLLITYAGVIGYGTDQVAQTWGQNPLGLSLLADQFVGQPLGALIELAVIIDFVVVIVAVANALSRGFFALARDGILPESLSALSRHQTPVAGLGLCLVIALAGIGIAGLAFDDRFEYLEMVVIAPGIIAAPIFLTLTVGSVRLVRSTRERLRYAPIALLASAVPALGLYGALDPFPVGTERWGLVIAGVIILSGMLVLAYLATRTPGVLRHAGDYATISPSSPGTDAAS